MRRTLAFFVFVFALGIYAPLTARADNTDAFTSFTLNGIDADAEISSEMPEVEIAVSVEEEAYFTRLYICPESADPCDGSSTIKFFSPNATTTSFTRSWEGLATSDEPVEPGVYQITARFFRYALQPDAFEETAPYTITIVDEDADDDGGDEDIGDGDGDDEDADDPPSTLSTFRWTPFTEDLETGERVYGDNVVFSDGAEEAVPFGIAGEISIETDFPVFGLEATLFYIPDPDSPTREFVASFGGFPNDSGGFSFPFDELTWSVAGVYELDIYEIEPPVLVQTSPWQRMFGWFVGQEAHAAEHSPLIGTIRFTVVEETPEPPAPVYQACCSSVIFLPGIKGSRLYMEGAEGEKKLWEPDRLFDDDDIRNLFLDGDGHSTDAVYAKEGDVLDSVGDERYYASLIADMNALVADGTIADFAPLAYDWRLSLSDIVSQGAEIDGRIFYGEATSTPYIEQTLRHLAQESQTGKVTVIAHSNGGLVAKKLIERLGDSEATELIDRIIMLGVPQSGAPQAIGALLFGYKEEITKVFPVVRKETARELAENSPMAYHLLPSQTYFDAVRDIDHPVASFEGSAYFAEQGAYGFHINTWGELSAFLLSEEGGRVKPAPSDTDSANVLNQTLLSYAEQTHDTLDAWTPPASIAVHQIAGWGIDTIAGVEFFDHWSAQLATGLQQPRRAYRPVIVEDGDGVVPISSALLISTSTENVKRWWFNVDQYNNKNKSRYEHSTIFEILDILTFINRLLMDESAYPPTILTSQPSTNTLSKKLRFFLHSPLTLTVLDANGNTVGEYDEFGDVKYVTVPAGATYTLSLTGLDSGTFTLEIEEIESGSTVASSTLANIPVSASTTATLTIGDSLASASALSVDIDGDGTVDATLAPQAGETTLYQEPEETGSSPAPAPSPSPSGGGPLWNIPTPQPQVLGASTTAQTFIASTTEATAPTTPTPSPAPSIKFHEVNTLLTPDIQPAAAVPPQPEEPPLTDEAVHDRTTNQTASALPAVSQQLLVLRAVKAVYAWIHGIARMFISIF